MPLGILIILASKAQGAAKIFNRRRWMADCFLPCVERLLESIPVFGFQFRLCKCVPDIGIVRSDGENSPTQLDNCRFVRGVFGCFQLGSQLRNLLARAESRNHGIDAQCQQECKCNEAGRGARIMDTLPSMLQWLCPRSRLWLWRAGA